MSNIVKNFTITAIIYLVIAIFLSLILLEFFSSNNYYILVAILLISIIIQVVNHPAIIAFKSLKNGPLSNKRYCLYLIILHLCIFILMLIILILGLVYLSLPIRISFIEKCLTIMIFWALVFVCLKIGLCIGIILDTDLFNKYQIKINVIWSILSLVVIYLFSSNFLWSLFFIPQKFPSSNGNPAIFISILLFSQVGCLLYKIFKPKKIAS